MLHVEGRADRRDRGDLGDVARRGERRRAAEAVADERSRTSPLKVLSAKLPSLSPSPVKSKRSTPKPRSVSARAMRTAASAFLVQVKQCAKRAKPRAGPSGRSSRPDKACPAAPVKSKGRVGMRSLPKILHQSGYQRRFLAQRSRRLRGVRRGDLSVSAQPQRPLR
jgi:hypothetical protein